MSDKAYYQGELQRIPSNWIIFVTLFRENSLFSQLPVKRCLNQGLGIGKGILTQADIKAKKKFVSWGDEIIYPSFNFVNPSH